MCAPVIPLVAAGVSAIGTGISMMSSINQAHAQAAAAQANANLDSNAAQIDQQNLRDAALHQYRQIAAMTGEQRLMAAASGNAVGYGTAANALGDTSMLGQEALTRLYSQGNQTLVGHDIAVANDLGQAVAARSRGSAALVGGLFNLANGALSVASSAGGPGSSGSGSAGTALGNASQYASVKAGFGI